VALPGVALYAWMVHTGLATETAGAMPGEDGASGADA